MCNKKDYNLGSCLIEACERKATHKGYCSLHYGREVLGKKARLKMSGLCICEGCDKPKQQKNMCDNHARAVRESKKIIDINEMHLKCKIEGCNTRISAMGFCRPHYVKEINSKKTGPKKANRTKKNFLVDFTDDSLDGKSYSGIWFKVNENRFLN